MRHRRGVTLLVGTIATIAACTEGPASPMDDALAFNHSNNMVPFKGSATFRAVGPGAPGPASDPGCILRLIAGLPRGEIWLPLQTGSGDFQSTQVGLSTFIADGCFDVANFPDGPFPFYFETVVTTANGDLLYYTATGVSDALRNSTGTGEITGGTGRFSGAHGTFDFWQLGNQTVLPTTTEFSGVISNRRSGG